jgi:hypothetical protein
MIAARPIARGKPLLMVRMANLLCTREHHPDVFSTVNIDDSYYDH